LIAGTLDILAALYFAGAAGMGSVQVLQFVASGPLGNVAMAHPAFAAAGLLVHFAIMACMTAVFILPASRFPRIRQYWMLAGLVYGLALWFVMYWLVLPARWNSMPPPTDIDAIAQQLSCHLLLVGLPIAFIASRCGRGTGIVGGQQPETVRENG
jgi:hypothetical protein